jgi:hypothetical protein
MTGRYYFVLLLAIALCACPNPNTYTSARTLRAGDAQLLVAAEGYASIDEVDGETETEVLPTLPTIGARYGVSNSFELALRLANLMSLGADTKIQLRRGELDIAVGPGVQWHKVDIEYDGDAYSAHAFDLHVPILFGWNLGPRVSLIASPGATFRTTVGPDPAVEHQWFALAGLGVNIRATQRFAVQPHATFMWDPIDGDGIFAMGLGFTFGGQPDFSGLDTQPTEPHQVARD